MDFFQSEPLDHGRVLTPLKTISTNENRSTDADPLRISDSGDEGEHEKGAHGGEGADDTEKENMQTEMIYSQSEKSTYEESEVFSQDHKTRDGEKESEKKHAMIPAPPPSPPSSQHSQPGLVRVEEGEGEEEETFEYDEKEGEGEDGERAAMRDDDEKSKSKSNSTSEAKASVQETQSQQSQPSQSEQNHKHRHRDKPSNIGSDSDSGSDSDGDGDSEKDDTEHSFRFGSSQRANIAFSQMPSTKNKIMKIRASDIDSILLSMRSKLLEDGDVDGVVQAIQAVLKGMCMCSYVCTYIRADGWIDE